MDFGEAMNQISDTLINIGLKYGTVTYTFTPYIESTWGGDSCMNWRDTTITVWVNPTPAIRVVAEDTVICSGETTNIRIHNPNEFVFGEWVYDLYVTPDPLIWGNMESDTALTETSISETLFNDDTIVHKVEYRFIPRKTIEDSLICSQVNDTTIVIWVNPTPEIRVDVSDTVLCDGDNVTLTVRNPNKPYLRGDWNGRVEIFADPGITGISSGIIQFEDDTIFNFTLLNSDPVARSITYRFVPWITPDDEGPDCGEGIVETVVVWVNPVPSIVIDVADTVICNDSYINFEIENPNTSIKGTWLYKVEVIPHPSITGAEAWLDTTIYEPDLSFSNLLHNTDTSAHEVVYHFTPQIEPEDMGTSCERWDTTITIWVNPTPALSWYVVDTIFCNNSRVDIDILDGMGYVIGDKKFEVQGVYVPSKVSVFNRAPNSWEVNDIPDQISDSIVNRTNEVQPVIYFIRPVIYDNREGKVAGELCGGVQPLKLIIYVNPTPVLYFKDLVDTIFCDSSLVHINVEDGLSSNIKGIARYNLEVIYNAGRVTLISAGATPGESDNSDEDINDYLLNGSDTIQTVSYHFMAHIWDDRPGHEGRFCDNGTDTTITIYLNPTPRLLYTLEEDTLCFDDGFTIFTGSPSYTTHPIYYGLDISNNNNIYGVATPAEGDSFAITAPLLQDTVMNLGTGWGRIIYDLHPFISTKGCPGADTTFVIDVNPEPTLSTLELSTPGDTAVCYMEGYSILMETDVDSTTGQFIYDLNTFNFDAGNLQNEQDPGDYPIGNLIQENVINTGDSIEDITYRIMPVIRNAKGPGEHCLGTWQDEIIVQVAPELKGQLVADEYIGGDEIRCFGELSGTLHSNVSGGYYREDYTFTWDTTGVGGTFENLIRDSIQWGLGVGEYWFKVTDTIGCEFTSLPWLVTQPDTIEVDTIITDATCKLFLKEDGAIDITVSGGNTAYSYYWTGRYGFNSTNEDVVSGVAGPYHLVVRDINLCRYDGYYTIGSASDILITSLARDYLGFGVECNGDNNGYIDLTVAGGFPGYDIKVYDHEENDTINAGTITTEGGGLRVDNLEAGTYSLFAFDSEQCYNDPPPVITLTEPDPIIVWKDNPRYSDTVDISCFGEDDGEIHLAMTGGRTHMYSNLFAWTGPDVGLVPNDSIQRDLEPGLYTVSVTDTIGCEGDTSFLLIEPSQITMQADNIFELNSWNVSCFGYNDGLIQITSQGGIMGHTYNWSSDAMTLPESTLEDQSGLVAGTYELKITDDIGCKLDTSFTLRQPNAIGIDTIIPKYSDFAIACADSSTGQIMVIPFGGADSSRNTYTWVMQVVASCQVVIPSRPAFLRGYII